jgi:hypothetical protein
MRIYQNISSHGVKFPSQRTYTDCDYNKRIYHPGITIRYHPFPAKKHHLGGHKFEDDFRVETAVTGWLIA